MAEELKSAVELAMEKLSRRGGAGGASLTDDQKHAIAEIRQEYEAKLAEREILYLSRREGAAGDLAALETLEHDYRRDREHLETRREARIREVREGKKP